MSSWTHQWDVALEILDGHVSIGGISFHIVAHLHLKTKKFNRLTIKDEQVVEMSHHFELLLKSEYGVDVFRQLLVRRIHVLDGLEHELFVSTHDLLVAQVLLIEEPRWLRDLIGRESNWSSPSFVGPKWRGPLVSHSQNVFFGVLRIESHRNVDDLRGRVASEQDEFLEDRVLVLVVLVKDGPSAELLVDHVERHRQAEPFNRV